MSNVQDTPGERLFSMASGCRGTQALYVVAKLGVADHLVNGPRTAGELAAKVNADARSLFRVMRALSGQGVFTQDSSDRFGLSPISKLLCTDDPESMRYVAIYMGEENYTAAGSLLHTVKTGETAFDHIFGRGHFDWMTEHPEASKTFNLFMAQSTRRYGTPLESYRLEGRSVIVDVGGGRGTLLAHILQTNPGLNGILYDLPQGCAEAAPFLMAQGVADRCKIMHGSFFDSVPSGGDVYFMSRILHDWPDRKARIILDNCRDVIPGDGSLLLREAVIPEGDAPSPGKQVDLIMLYMLGGAERTEPEWRRLLSESKFALRDVTKANGAFDLISAEPM
jgi:O-methyltransferase domain